MARPRVLIFDPFLSTLGGGERYALAVGEALAAEADVVLAGEAIPSESAFAERGFVPPNNMMQLDEAAFTAFSARFDTAVVVTNLVPPASKARHSYAIVQFPFFRLHRHPEKRLHQWRTLAPYKLVVYSRFAQRWTRRRWWRSSHVLYPHATMPAVDPTAKRPSLLAVGRFFVGGHNKRHDALLNAYAALPPDVRSRWRLTMVGGVGSREADRAHFSELVARAAEIGVTVIGDAPAQVLAEEYRRASIYWQATGFGREARHPEAAEHFGWAALDAMAAGAVPVAYADGGTREIVSSHVGHLWRTLDELVAATTDLAHHDDRRAEIAARATTAASTFDRATFDRRARQLFMTS